MGIPIPSPSPECSNVNIDVPAASPPLLPIASPVDEPIDMTSSSSDATSILDDFLTPLDLSVVPDWSSYGPAHVDASTIPEHDHHLSEDFSFLPTSPMSVVDDQSAPTSPVSVLSEAEEEILAPAIFDAGLGDNSGCHLPDSMPVDRQQVGKAVQELEGVLRIDQAVRGRRKGGRKPRAKANEAEMERMRGMYARLVMKQKKKRYKVARPSNFCHICGRKAWLTQVAVCGNVSNRDCRKVICKQCFAKFGMDDTVLKKALTNPEGVHYNDYVDPSWKCPHCRDACPSGSQCSTYKVTNFKRHMRLKENRIVRAGRCEKKPRKKKARKVVVKCEETTTSSCSDCSWECDSADSTVVKKECTPATAMPPPVHLSVHQPAHTPVRQPAQSHVHQPAQLPVHQPAQLPVHQPARPPVHQPARPPVHQPAHSPAQPPAVSFTRTKSLQARMSEMSEGMTSLLESSFRPE